MTEGPVSDRKLILVADDDKDLVTALSIRLKAAGYGVVGAHDGEEAFSVAQEHKPDLIILDVRMPAGGGFSSIDKIKHSLNTRNIPVILLTNLGQKSDVLRGLDLGATDYLIKAHFMPSEVIDKIKQTLTKNRRS